MARKYEMKRRAERQQETRRRITEAAVELHQTVGPARTTISAIAEKAGVQRHTFYAHFPEEIDLHRACAGHYMAHNPPPDPGSWAEIPDAQERLRTALGEVYAFYGRTEPMFANVLRDAQVHPLVAEVAAPVRRYWEEMRDVLAGAFEVGGERRETLVGAIALALDFQTWRTLVRQQSLDDERAVELMACTVRCALRG
jgi:AcrR family transcriptional regulator